MGHQTTSVPKSSTPKAQTPTAIAPHSRPFPTTQTPPVFDTPQSTLPTQPMVQCQGTSTAGAISPGLEQSIQQERGKGQTLSESLRNPLENAFGADFSGVRIHTDNTADQLNQSIQAKAFTTGQDVFFRQGAYAPESKSGQALLAHELTHTIQQGSSPTVQRKIQVIQRAGEGDQTKPSAPPSNKSLLDKALAPGVYPEILKWMENKSSSQKQYHTFQFFKQEKLDIQEATIINILLTPAEKAQIRDLPNGQYLFNQFDKNVKTRFVLSGFWKGADDIDWAKFAKVCREAGASSQLLEELHTAEVAQNSGSKDSGSATGNAILDVSGLSVADNSLQKADRVAGGLTLAGNIALTTGKIVATIAKVSAASGIGGILSGAADAATGIVGAVKNTERAKQSAKLKNSENKAVATGAKVNESQQKDLRTNNIGLAVQGAIAAAVGIAAFACPVVALVGLGVGLIMLAGRSIYMYFKTKQRKEKIADEMLKIDTIKNDKERQGQRTKLLHQNGYDSVDAFYEDFVKMVSSDLYLYGVLGGESEQAQLISSLGLKINKTGKEPHPTQQEIAAKYGI